MDYFKLLNLKKEPFSNSPDPDFFYGSPQHVTCLQKLELAIRLKRGLNVVTGDVGTGKTTLCRQLLRRFTRADKTEIHLILDPGYDTPLAFLRAVARMLAAGKKVPPPPGQGEHALKEWIKQRLFHQCAQHGGTIVLVIDEGQKLNRRCLELLRELLNYETNQHKLLQIVIFGQRELETTLARTANFADRINFKFLLQPLDFRSTRAMIRFRLALATRSRRTPKLFSWPALWAIYRASRGYPRKIVTLCHQAIMAMIVTHRDQVGRATIKLALRSALGCPAPTRRPARVVSGVLVLLMCGGLLWWHWAMLTPVWQLVAMPPAEARNLAGPYKIKPFKIIPPAAQPAAVKTAGIRPAVKTGHRGRSSMPAFLGSVPIGPRETLGELVHRIYGTATKPYLAKVIAANAAGIDDPHKVSVGQRIFFPSIQSPVPRTPASSWWIKIRRERSLESAVTLLRQHAPHKPPLHLVPHWDRKSGLTFTIVLKEVFFDETAARNYLRSLPAGLADTAELVSAWAYNTVFFSDPYDIQS